MDKPFSEANIRLEGLGIACRGLCTEDIEGLRQEACFRKAHVDRAEAAATGIIQGDVGLLVGAVGLDLRIGDEKGRRVGDFVQADLERRTIGSEAPRHTRLGAKAEAHERNAGLAPW